MRGSDNKKEGWKMKGKIIDLKPTQSYLYW